MNRTTAATANNRRGDQRNQIKGMTQMAFFAAVIVLMAFVPFLGYIPLGFTRATIIHIPVIIGSLMLGPKKGAALGFVFGLTSFINNTMNPTVTSFVFTPFYTLGEYSGGIGSLIICFVPRILVGVVPYFVHRGIMKLAKEKKGAQYIALPAAGVAGALVNTLLVMNLIYFCFSRTFAAAKNIAVSAVYDVILGIIAANGIPEAIAAALLTLAVGRALLRFMAR